MQRRFSAVAVALVCSALSTPAASGPLEVGLHAGSSIPNLHAGNSDPISNGWSSRVAFSFGLFAEYHVSPTWSIQPEINYAPQGGKRDGAQPVPDAEALGAPPGTLLYANYHSSQEMSYLEIPVLAKYHIGGARQFYATLGPYVGFLLNAKYITSGTSQLYLDPQLTQPASAQAYDFGGTQNVKSALHSTNWGIQAGLGYGRPLGVGRIELDVRGGYGLMNVQKDAAANGSNNTGALVVSLGYGVSPH
jgi:hypothetical protein